MEIAALDLKYAFLAGLLEGDGCIQLSSRKNPRMAFGVEVWMVIEVTNTKKELLDFLKDNFGGNIYSRKRRKNWSSSHCWRLCREKAKVLLLHMYPYLITKKEQAKLAVKFQAIVSIRGQGSNTLCTQREHKERMKLVEEMHTLNLKGMR